MKAQVSYISFRYILLISISLISLNLQVYAQELVIKNAIENLTEKAEAEFDYSDILDEFLDLKENPANLNSSTESQKLISLFLLSDLQYQNLKQYIDSNGLLLSSKELLLIDGFDIQTINSLAPFVKAEEVKKHSYPKPSNVLKYGHHQIFLRYQRVLQNIDGYVNRTDSVINDNPNSKYLGNADKYYFKYKFNYKNRITASLVAEKDAGELFFENIENPTLDSLIGDKIAKGFDFYAANIYMQNIGMVDQVVIGDYHLLFGQGLNMWSALSFGKSSAALNIRKYERGIKPNTSTDENKFMRGAAIKLGHKRWKITAFYSKKKQDASDFLSPEDQETHFLSSLNGTGYHRTVNEILKKNAVEVQLFGGRLQYMHNNFKLGITASHTKLDKEVLAQNSPYQHYQFKGNTNTILGGDYEFRLYMLNFFGEYSYQINGGWAYLGGITAPLSSRFAIAMLYRNYQKDYVNLFGAAFGENTQNTNEQGFYLGFNLQLSPKLQLNAYSDIFRFSWLKFRIDAPSYGSEFLAQLNYEYSRRVLMHFKIRYKNKMLNYDTDYNHISNLQKQEKYSFRYHISYELHPQLKLKNRIEYQIFNTKSDGKQYGFLIYQDIAFKTKNNKWNISARFALFDVDDYDSRIYAYENDLLYVFSVPAYYNRGVRAYGLVSYKISGTFQFWLKLANTWYENADEISSGLNRIDGSHKTEIRCQLRIKI
ncbi:MAG: hypothetical protein KAH25_01545 [Bacteroidales bacterium]|nr:hypothetical protein [Bacteroidales bacterium]